MSPTTLTRDQVRHIAMLARLTLSDAEIELFTRQLADILQYAEQVQQVDTSGVPPTAHVTPQPTAFRDDTPAASLDRDAVLAQAPAAARDAGLFKVPKVL